MVAIFPYSWTSFIFNIYKAILVVDPLPWFAGWWRFCKALISCSCLGTNSPFWWLQQCQKWIWKSHGQRKWDSPDVYQGISGSTQGRMISGAKSVPFIGIISYFRLISRCMWGRFQMQVVHHRIVLVGSALKVYNLVFVNWVCSWCLTFREKRVILVRALSF